MKVARTVLNGESGSNAADLHNKVMPNERQSVDLYMKSGWNSEPRKIPSISRM